MAVPLMVLHWLAMGAYLDAAWREARLSCSGIWSSQVQGENFSKKTDRQVAAGLILHAISLCSDTLQPWRFGVGPLVSATLWVGMLIAWEAKPPVPVLRATVLTLTAGAVLLPLWLTGNILHVPSRRPLFALHLIVGTLAYGLLMLAAFHAILAWTFQKKLRGMRLHANSWVEKLPPLLLLEKTLFRLIAVGFLLLTLTVVSGVLFSKELFHQPLRLDMKTVTAFGAWLVFGMLLLGRWSRGWRGRTALNLTLLGFVSLVIAYVGTRLI